MTMAGRTRILIATLLLAGSTAALPAQARPYRHEYNRSYYRHRGGGNAVAAGIIGGVIGLGLGAALAGAPPPPVYYQPPPAYYPPPPPVYYGTPYPYY